MQNTKKKKCLILQILTQKKSITIHLQNNCVYLHIFTSTNVDFFGFKFVKLSTFLYFAHFFATTEVIAQTLVEHSVKYLCSCIPLFLMGPQNKNVKSSIMKVQFFQ